METTTTEPTVERVLVTGGDPDAPFRVPIFSGDFRDAPELARIGNALIATCDEFEDLKWAIEEDGFEIAYVWKKKASKSADKFVAGKQGKPGGLAKHFASEAKGAPVGYTVVLAADANYGQTNWQIEARVFHELYHCKIGRKTVGKGDDKRTVPVLKVKAHDLEMFWAERRRYGDWHSALKKGTVEFSQSRLPMDRAEEPRAHANGYDPSVGQAPGVEDELGPVDGGAPAADWAGQWSDADQAQHDHWTTGDAEPNDDTHDPETGMPRVGFWAERERRVRENFPAEFADGARVCRACGVTIEAHDPEVCQGGTPAQRSGRRKAKNGKPESDATNGVDLVLGHSAASNGNGALFDPDAVMAMLSGLGWSIAFHKPADADEGRYVNPDTGAAYDTGDVETEYRNALAGRAR